MVKVDVMDKYTPTGGDREDMLPPYVVNGLYGHPINLSYTEKVRGSSPFAPTKKNLAGVAPLPGFWINLCPIALDPPPRGEYTKHAHISSSF
jgi:hypothetical protein